MRSLGGWVLTALDADYPARLPPSRSRRRSRSVSVSAALDLGAAHGGRGGHAPPDHRRARPGRAGRRAGSSEAGAVVVSGLAVGIDGAPTAAALEARRPDRRRDRWRTRAPRTGRPSPAWRAHRDGTARSSASSPPGVPPTRGTFPRRNRIISGLAIRPIVVEAPARSGALITARHALEQGRRLLVPPGRRCDPRVAGYLALLREIACPPARRTRRDDRRPGPRTRRSGDQRARRGRRGRGAAGLDATAALRCWDRASGRSRAPCAAGPHDGRRALPGHRPRAGPRRRGALTLLQLRGWSQPFGAHAPAGRPAAGRRTPRPAAAVR